MGFREVSVVEVREMLRLWRRGQGLRRITATTGSDRKTVRRYVEAAVRLGVSREGPDEDLSDGLIGLLFREVRPEGHQRHGSGWERLDEHRDRIAGWLGGGLTVVKVHELLARQGVMVAYRTLHRFCAGELGFGQRPTTLRVADGEPGGELQVDFGRLGRVPDPSSGRRRVCHALVLTACYSRHCFVWLTFQQTLAAIIAGLEAGWQFFGGVFRVLIPDNVGAIVVKADAVSPRFNDVFLEYAQARGFVIDAARVRRPTDKPRVERSIAFVTRSFFAGESFHDLDDAQSRAVDWCLKRAGLRIHGTTQARPLEVFQGEELPLLLPAPAAPYDMPHVSHPKVHRDHHAEVLRALYSIPGNLIGEELTARADRHLVKFFHKGELVKVHPRHEPGRRSTDRADLPAERTAYALRDITYLKEQARRHGESVGGYAEALLDSPLPWTRMRQVYRLLGLVKRHGAGEVDEACRRALELEVVNVTRIERMLERALEASGQPEAASAHVVAPSRFARSASEFAVSWERR